MPCTEEACKDELGTHAHECLTKKVEGMDVVVQSLTERGEQARRTKMGARMNALVALMIVGGGIAFAFALVSMLDKKEKRRLLNQAEEAARALYHADGQGELGDPDEAWWGNGCLLLLYADLSTVVASAGKSSKIVPARSILECSAIGSMDNVGTSRLILSLNDPMSPEMVLDFPGDGAIHPQRAIAALIANQPKEDMAPPTVVSQEEEPVEEDELPNEHVIDTTPRHSNIIMDAPQHNRDIGRTVIIDG